MVGADMWLSNSDAHTGLRTPSVKWVEDPTRQKPLWDLVNSANRHYFEGPEGVGTETRTLYKIGEKFLVLDSQGNLASQTVNFVKMFRSFHRNFENIVCTATFGSRGDKLPQSQKWRMTALSPYLWGFNELCENHLSFVKDSFGEIHSRWSK
jgi:mRNA-degrading endonuclease HigB of HigAB toxin-antitoxin module